MKLIDVHRHIDGSLRLETLHALSKQLGIAIPPHKDIVFHPGMGLSDALQRFSFTLSLLQQFDALHRVVTEICEDAEKNNVVHLELRFAPQLHHMGAMDEVVDVVLDALHPNSTLILCGLYGENPSTLEKLVDIAIPRKKVSGIDLAGGPLPHHQYEMHDYRSSFSRAKDHGIGRTVHAGEGRPPAEIAKAILELHAQRIGHGTTLLDDPDVAHLIRKKNVCIEACVTSNVHTGVISDIQHHPIVRWIEQDIPVTICTDNTLLSQVNAPEEYEHVSKIEGMNPMYIEKTIEYGRSALFKRT